MRLFPALLALILALGAVAALRKLDPSQSPDVFAFAALNQPQPEVQKAVGLYTEALRRDSANPYRWSDLGQALLSAGNREQARSCYRRALELSRQVPQVWLRDANFHFELDEPQDALRSAAHVLKTVPDYDSVLFGYFDRLIDSPSAVLAQIGDDRRATRSYLQHLVGTGNMDGARAAWDHALVKGFNDDPLTASYVDGLLRAHRYLEAKQDWSRSLGDNRGDYPDRNLIFNGGFEREPSGCALDWRIQPSDAFETTRDHVGHDGKWALKLQFHGNANVSYQSVIQLVPIRPGNYLLRAWVRTDGITTNEGPRLAIQDAQSPNLLNIRSDPFLGTAGWTPVTIPFTVGPHTSLISIRVIRESSPKFDSKIDGAFWLDSISLAGT
jgi:tetratricopeptide (TPR) repeat protein